MTEKEKEAETTLVHFLIAPYFILPGCRKDLRHCCLCDLRTALQSLFPAARLQWLLLFVCACDPEAEPEAASAGCNSRRPIRNPSKINLLETNEAQIVHAL